MNTIYGLALSGISSNQGDFGVSFRTNHGIFSGVHPTTKRSYEEFESLVKYRCLLGSASAVTAWLYERLRMSRVGGAMLG